MTALPPSPFMNSAETSSHAADTAATIIQPHVVAAATNPALGYVPPEAEPAPAAELKAAVGGSLDEIDCIHEIFHHARRLVREQNRFVLDETPCSWKRWRNRRCS